VEKNAQQLKEAYKEIKQPKVGRIARLTGKVRADDWVRADSRCLGRATSAAGRQSPEAGGTGHAEVADMLEGMRAKERPKLAAE